MDNLWTSKLHNLTEGTEFHVVEKNKPLLAASSTKAQDVRACDFELLSTGIAQWMPQLG